MAFIDWAIVIGYCITVLAIGLILARRANANTAEYFVSGRKLGWFIMGTSIVATTFSSDTPLLVTKLTREKGIWGNWEWWCLGFSHILAIFFFSKFWKRAGVMTEVELVELRYDGKAASFLRGFKAIAWGVVYNCILIGGMPILGMSMVMQETTGWSRGTTVIFCMTIATAYSIFSGLWGVVVNDVFQFVLAMIGAIILAIYTVSAAGGTGAIISELTEKGNLNFVPAQGGDFWTSPFSWFMALILIQWWAYKNSDGGGVIVQRFVSSKDEKNATYGTLWFNIAHYALRSWPWIMTALASLILLPDVDQPERAYPRLINMVLPAGLRGILVASFLAAFMSNVVGQMNWGASYVVNDFYKRFIAKGKSEAHYIKVSWIAAFGIMCLASLLALVFNSVERTFAMILSFSAGIGVINLARWFWWRVNAYSEIAVLASTMPAFLLQNKVAHALGIVHGNQESLPFNLLFIIVFTAIFWIPVTLLTKPVNIEKLRNFYRLTHPPKFGWRPVKDLVTHTHHEFKLGRNLLLWLVGVLFLYLATFSIGKLLLGDYTSGILYLTFAIAIFINILWAIRTDRSST